MFKKIKNIIQDKYNFLYLIIGVVFLYIINNFTTISAFKNIYWLLTLNTFTLTEFIPGIYSSLIVFSLLIFIIFLYNKLKTNNKLKSIVILFLIAIIISYLTNLYLITLPTKLIVIFNILLYLSILISFLYDKQILEIIFLIFFYPALLIMYKIWLWAKFFISLITKRAENLTKLEKKLYIIIKFIFFLWVLQFTAFLMSKANPIFKDLIYNNLYKLISNLVASLSITFSLVAIFSFLERLKNLQIFSQKIVQKPKNTNLLQKGINLLFDLSFIKILFYATSLTIFIYELTNIYSLITFRLGTYTFDIGLNKFAIKNIAITTLITITLSFIYFYLNNKKHNNIRKISSYLIGLNFITTFYIFITLFAQYSFTISRVYFFFVLLMYYVIVLLLIKNKFSRLKEAFIATIGLLSIPTILLIVFPWFYSLNVLWKTIPTKYNDYMYFYSKQLLPTTYIHTVNASNNKPFNAISNLYQQFVFCNSKKVYDLDYELTLHKKFNNKIKNHNLVHLIEQSAKQYNLLAFTIVEYTNQNVNCHKINNVVKKLAIKHIKHSKRCPYFACTPQNLKLNDINLITNSIRFNLDKKLNYLFKNTQQEPYSNLVEIKLKYNQKINAFYFNYVKVPIEKNTMPINNIPIKPVNPNYLD